MIYGVTPQGFVRKPYSVILDEILLDYETAFPGFRKHESNALYVQVQAAANREEKFWATLEAMYYSRFVITASGTSLELRVIDTIGPRIEPTYAIGTCKAIATPGTILPQGTLVNRSDGLVQYRLTKTYVAKDNNAFEVQVQATVSGTAGNIVAGMITNFATTIIGAQSIYNDIAIIGGEDIEDDDALKERYYASLVDSRGSNIPAISAKVRNATTVSAYRLRENRKGTEQTVDGVLMPSHSIALTVIGGTDDEVAKALFQTKAGGIDMVGDTSVEVKDVDGTPYTMQFIRANGTTVFVSANIVVDFLYLPQYTERIQKQIADFINHLGIDEKLEYNLLVAKAFDGIAGVKTITLTVGRSENPSESADIIPTANEKFVISESGIVLNVVRG